MKKLKADMVEMEKAMFQLRKIHQVELERKDAFCEVEKERITKALQETYNAMLPGRDALRFEAGYRWGYSKVVEDAEERLRGSDEEAISDVPT